MSSLYGFLTGAALGSGITLACALAWKGQSGVGLGEALSPGGLQGTARLEDKLRALRTKNEALEAKLELREADLERLRGQGTTDASDAATDPAAPVPAPAPAVSPTSRPAPIIKELDKELRLAGALLRRSEAGPEERSRAFATLLEALRGNDADAATAAGRHLWAVGDHLTDDEIKQLRRELASRVSGDPLRPILAAAVAKGLHDDPGLAAYLGALPREEEPEIRESILKTLDRFPSPAYREYTLRILRDEQNADVVEEALDEDRIVSVLNDSTAPEIVRSLDARLSGGGLTDVKVRGQGYLGLGLAAIHDATAAQGVLERLVPTERHAGLRAYGQAILDTVRAGEANLAVLDRLRKEHRRSLRD